MHFVESQLSTVMEQKTGAYNSKQMISVFSVVVLSLCNTKLLKNGACSCFHDGAIC